jgi:hypothetical protein
MKIIKNVVLSMLIIGCTCSTVFGAETSPSSSLVTLDLESAYYISSLHSLNLVLQDFKSAGYIDDEFVLKEKICLTFAVPVSCFKQDEFIQLLLKLKVKNGANFQIIKVINR